MRRWPRRIKRKEANGLSLSCQQTMKNLSSQHVFGWNHYIGICQLRFQTTPHKSLTWKIKHIISLIATLVGKGSTWRPGDVGVWHSFWHGFSSRTALILGRSSKENLQKYQDFQVDGDEIRFPQEQNWPKRGTICGATRCIYHYLMYPFNQTWSDMGFWMDLEFKKPPQKKKNIYIYIYTKTTRRTPNFLANFLNLPIVIFHTDSFSFLYLMSLSRYGNNATKLQWRMVRLKVWWVYHGCQERSWDIDGHWLRPLSLLGMYRCKANGLTVPDSEDSHVMKYQVCPTE